MDILIIAIFGLCIGSFLNVCIYRIPRHISVLNPRRSFCPKCNQQLSAFDNIPLLSWVFLAGKCRYCKAAISGQYPFVEALSAMAAIASYLQFGTSSTALIIYALTGTLIVISFIDLEFMIIPDVISFPGMIVGFVLAIVTQFAHPFQSPPLASSVLDSFLGLLAGGGFFFVIAHLYYFITGRDGLGGGDVKLMGLTGAMLGLRSVVPIIFAGSLFGSVVGIGAMIIKGKGRHTELPFGPWLSIGAILYVFLDLPCFRVY